MGDNVPAFAQKVADGGPSQLPVQRVAGFFRSLRTSNCRGAQNPVPAARILVGKEWVLCAFLQLSKRDAGHLRGAYRFGERRAATGSGLDAMLPARPLDLELDIS